MPFRNVTIYINKTRLQVIDFGERCFKPLRTETETNPRIVESRSRSIFSLVYQLWETDFRSQQKHPVAKMY